MGAGASKQVRKPTITERLESQENRHIVSVPPFLQHPGPLNAVDDFPPIYLPAPDYTAFFLESSTSHLPLSPG